MSSSTSRLAQIDALRGIAALLVVLFHFTTRYDDLYHHTAPTLFSVPWGHLGVNLFFMISGYVIFMTLERTTRPLDFVVSRVSRLYPAYWVAIVLTFTVVYWLGLPGKEVSATHALANLTMLHSFFNVPNVDGVYWTLEVELLFYAWALLCYRLGLLGRVHWILAALFGLRLCYHLAATWFGIDLPWIASRLLILPFIAWFGAGIMVYRLSRGSDSWRQDLACIAAAVLLVGVTDSVGMGLLLAALAPLLYGAARGRIPLLDSRVLVGLGTISYSLYLLHENIGWAVMRQLETRGWTPDLAIGAAALLVFALAIGVTLLVERPAMAWARQRYRRRAGQAQPAPAQGR